MKKRVLIVVFLFCYGLLFSDEYDDVRQILMEQERRSVEYKEPITFLQKVNMGISGGDNWLAEWNNRLVMVYSIENNRIIERFVPVSHRNPNEETLYGKQIQCDIMSNIPGKRIGTGSSVIGDYNNDGYDEIFYYAFAPHWHVSIYGYNSARNDLASYCDIPFWIIDIEKGPIPVEFMTYQGVDGFKVCYLLYEGTPVHPPKHAVDGLAWYFYAWDEVSRQFVELAEIGEDIDYSVFTKPEPEEPDAVEPGFDIDTPAGPETPETVDPAADETGVESKQSSLVLFAGIGAGLLVLALILCIIIRKKK
jgi:hypothetical protein